jgi:IS30 family transposase
MSPISLAPLSGRYLSFAEREEIAILHAQHVGLRHIARRISRSPSTISRELRRNAATRSGGLEYRATTAQWHADRKAKRPKVAKLVAHDELGRVCQVVEKSERGIRRLISTVYAATAAAVTCGISCHPSIFRTLM